MEENPFSEGNSYSADKEITSIWYDLKADNCVHKNIQVDSVLHQKNQVHTLTLSFLNTLVLHHPHSHTHFLQYPVLHQKN